jgi:hypothetical protein
VREVDARRGAAADVDGCTGLLRDGRDHAVAQPVDQGRGLLAFRRARAGPSLAPETRGHNPSGCPVQRESSTRPLGR